MVLCKYFQQGTCRYGQYCKFEHSYGNRSKTFNEEKNLALMVAEETLQAERGGQWLLSCYGPFKEKKCIPGMDDVSPEEVRWEMYQAQKNGTADQVNAQFQQMCEQMKAKRDALKNPTSAIYQMLEEINNGGTDTANKGNFAFGASQLSTSNTNQSSNVFGQKTTFGATSSNPFGSTSTFSSNQQTSSIFSRSAAAPATNVFGAKASFGGTSVFGGASTSGGSIFGGASKPASAPFGAVQNTSTFGGLAAQGTSIFGGSTTTQTPFGQPPAFGATNQVSNPMFKPQTSQTSVFGGGTAAGGNVFGAPTTSTATNSVFGVQPGASAATNTQATTNLFGQTATAAAAFGGGPVFGGAAAFGAQNAPSASVFGGQSAFGQASAAPAATNVFGGPNAGTSSFETLAQNPNANAFGAAPNASPFGATATATVAPNASPFGTANPAVATMATGAAPNVSPFGATTSAAVAPNASPFGVAASTAAPGPFGSVATAANPAFGAPTSTAAPGPFGQSMSFGFASPTTIATTSTTNVFGTSTAQPAFGGSAFGGASTSTNVFGTTTAAQQAGNPFLAKTTSSPFGAASSAQSSPFGGAATSNNNVFGVSVNVVIDETAYTPNESLTDDEKATYKMTEFILGRIPLNPPSKELA